MPATDAYLEDILARLESFENYGYRFDSPAASEPTALAAFALMAFEKYSTARLALDWLAETQQQDGCVGVTRSEERPGWPTSLAIAAWNHFHLTSGTSEYVDAITKGRLWLMQVEGHTMPKPAKSSHDTTLLGWPWAEGTHSWLEPTAFCVLSLKTIGEGDNPRTREAVRLLTDRQIPGGGCNYGNTFVLGQTMMPHIQPSGIALLALAGEKPDPRVQATIGFLEREWPDAVGTSSICFAAMGLAAHGRAPIDLTQRLAESYTALLRRQNRKVGGYKLALLALASLGPRNPLVNRA